MLKGLKVALVVAVVSLTAAAAAFAASDRIDATSGDTLVFGAASEPTSLDGAVVSDGESLRVIAQIMEGLVTLKAGTTTVIPQLATKWKATSGGKVWTFTLRKGVRFHDGTPFNARAVCANFDRWYNATGPFASDATSYYYYTVFGGWKKAAKGLTNTAAVSQLQGRRRHDRGDHASPLERRVPRRTVAAVVRDPEPDGAREVRGEQGLALEGRRLRPGWRLRRSRWPGGRHRPVQARVVEDRRQARDRPQRLVLGPRRRSCVA